jgi:hypothetical protein
MGAACQDPQERKAIMTRHLLAALAAAVAVSAAPASAQTRDIYHWRSFDELASVLHIADDDGYEVVVEKWGPLFETEGWPVETYISFSFQGVGAQGVQGYCQLTEDAFSLNPRTGEARLDAVVTPDDCYWLEGASALRIQLTWTPDGSYHTRRHYTLLGDMNRTSSEQGWEDRWLLAYVQGTLWLNGASLPLTVPVDDSGKTMRSWGHGVIPFF